MYIILVNDGLFEGNKVFNNIEEINDCLSNWSDGEEFIDEDGEVVDVEDLIDCRVDLINDNMCEMGDDSVSIGIVKLNMNVEFVN